MTCPDMQCACTLSLVYRLVHILTLRTHVACVTLLTHVFFALRHPIRFHRRSSAHLVKARGHGGTSSCEWEVAEDGRERCAEHCAGHTGCMCVCECLGVCVFVCLATRIATVTTAYYLSLIHI